VSPFEPDPREVLRSPTSRLQYGVVVSGSFTPRTIRVPRGCAACGGRRTALLLSTVIVIRRFDDDQRRRAETLSRRLISAATVRGISRHPHAFACARCQHTRCSREGRVGITCRRCQLAFMVQSPSRPGRRARPRRMLCRCSSKDRGAAFHRARCGDVFLARNPIVLGQALHCSPSWRLLLGFNTDASPHAVPRAGVGLLPTSAPSVEGVRWRC